MYNIEIIFKKENMEKDITKPNDEIKSIVKQFSKNKYEAVIESMLWMRKNLSLGGYDRELFRKRDAAQLLKSKKLTGCSDVAILYISFMRALGIKATFIQTISKETIEEYTKESDKDLPIIGHVFVRVHIDEISMIVDPTYSQIYLKEKFPSDSRIINALIIGEGTEMNSIEKIKDAINDYIKKRGN